MVLSGSHIINRANELERHNEENRLRQAVNGGTTVDYAYDPLGRRRSKSVNGTITYFMYEGPNELAELNSSGTRQRFYANGNGMDERVGVHEDVGAYTGWQFFHTNHQGSVLYTTRAATSGALHTSFHYGAYGESSDPPTGNPIRYTGRYLDAETGLYYYRARYYSPKLGRFLQTDPIGTKDDLNLYAYVYGDPLNRSDPTGLCRETEATTCRTPTGSRIERSYEIDESATEQSGEIRLAQVRPPPRGGRGSSRYAGNPGAGRRDPGNLGSNPSNAQQYIPGGSLAQNETLPGAHVLQRHVGQSVTQLQARLRSDPTLSRASSFSSSEQAETAIGEALAQSQVARLNVGSGQQSQQVFRVDLGVPTGITLLRGSEAPQTSTAVRIVIRHNPASDTGYIIITAYPD